MKKETANKTGDDSLKKLELVFRGLRELAMVNFRPDIFTQREYDLFIHRVKEVPTELGVYHKIYDELVPSSKIGEVVDGAQESMIGGGLALVVRYQRE